MSRFLDALRDGGKSSVASDTKGARQYAGQIVDVDHVLGSETTGGENPDADLLQHQTDDSGEQETPQVQQVPETNAPLSLQEDETEDRKPFASDVQVTKEFISESTEAVAPPAFTRSTAADTGVVASDSDHESVGRRRWFTWRSLDPLFYLIVGIAALGLFASIYALITQNDAYFEREFQQLQKESAALQARLATTASLAVADDRPQVQLQADLTARANEVASPVAEAASVVSEVIIVDSQTPIATAERSSDGGVTSVVPPATVSSTSIAVNDFAIDDFARVDALERLQLEVNQLHSLLAQQQDKISRLEQDRLNLLQSIESLRNTSNGNSSTATTEVQPVSRSAAVRSDKPATAAIEVKRTESIVSPVRPALNNPVASVDSDVATLVNRGFMAYQSEDYASAGAYYGDALQFDPYNRDANLGVAAVAQINGELTLAEDRYRHLLTLDPSDAVAFSALLNLAGSTNRSNIEFELSQHVQYVKNPYPLYAILGNYYSQQQRWADAERAYAVSITAGGNADYLFNYAVALDNLRRTEQAAEYYSRALNAISTGSYSFDISGAEDRLQSLRAASQ